MFTGIVEEMGVVQSVRQGARSSAVSIQGQVIFSDLKLGDSVSVNGVCLTVSHIANHVFTADVMHETLNRSTTGGLKAGSHVNLERAMAADGRFGGHMVTGHIDGTGVISDMKKDDNAVLLTVKASEKIMRYIVEKGSVAIDGISLTVAHLKSDTFVVSIIPHTLKLTILADKSIGDSVNLENDMFGKYVEKFMKQGDTKEKQQGITRELLSEHGFGG